MGCLYFMLTAVQYTLKDVCVSGSNCVTGGGWTLEEAASEPGRASLQQGCLSVSQPQWCTLWAAPHASGEGGLCWVYYGRWVAVHHDVWFHLRRRTELENIIAFLSTASCSNVSCCVSTGQSSSAAKLKSLTGAIEIMTETRFAFQLIHKELLEEQIEVSFRAADGDALSCLFIFAKLCSVGLPWSQAVSYNIFSFHFPSCSRVNQTLLNQQSLLMWPVAPPRDWISRKWWS